MCFWNSSCIQYTNCSKSKSTSTLYMFNCSLIQELFQKHIHKVKFYPGADNFTQALLVTNIMSAHYRFLFSLSPTPVSSQSLQIQHHQCNNYHATIITQRSVPTSRDVLAVPSLIEETMIPPYKTLLY